MYEESKREKFVRLAENRVNSTLKDISLIGNLSNKSNYDYTKEDVDKIIRTLKKSVNDLEMNFASKNRSDFKL
ncbi:MAG: hypothetical protein IKL68_00905 [Clostridia bacterium]|nr:hypothetical protein [Clostridia bacterium]